jgi:hypothetical protein
VAEDGVLVSSCGREYNLPGFSEPQFYFL